MSVQSQVAHLLVNRPEPKRGVASEQKSSFYYIYLMNRVQPSEVFEAEELLAEIASWSEDEIEELPKFYREKAREYRRLTNSSEE